MELADLSREDWESLVRAVSLQESRDREHAAMKEGARRAEVTGWAEHLKQLHTRFQVEFRQRCLDGRMPPYQGK